MQVLFLKASAGKKTIQIDLYDILRASPTAAGPCSRDAWFLVILCFISLLKCVLARLFLDVNFQVTFLTHNYHLGRGYGHFWCPKPVIWQAWCSTLAPWGTMGRSRGHLGAQERRPWGPGLDDGKYSQSDWSCGGKALAF